MLLRSLYSQVEDVNPVRTKRNAAVRATETLRVMEDLSDGGGKVGSESFPQAEPNLNLEEKFAAAAPAPAPRKKFHAKQMLRAEKRMLEAEAKAKRDAEAQKSIFEPE